MPSACAASSASAIFDRQRQNYFRLHAAAPHPVLQRQAVQKLHGDERLAVVLANFVDGADIGMVQGRCGLGFALEAGEGLGVLGNIIGQELQGDEAMQLHVLGLVDDTHPAAAELLDDAVVRDGLPDHVWRRKRMACPW